MKARVSIRLALAIVCALLALPAPALATPPEEVTIEAEGLYYGSSPYMGDFIASGLFFDSGSVTIWTWYSNWFVVHSYALLESSEGSILIHSQGLRTGTVLEGRWVILSGTGLYENLHGEGELNAHFEPSDYPLHIFWTWTGKAHFD
jgi:hypothetical protein